MDVDVSCFVTRALGGCISTIRRTRISVRRNCIWEKSAWSARGPARRRQLFGRRKGCCRLRSTENLRADRSEEHTSELQSHSDLVCRLLLEKKKASLRRLGTHPPPR